MAERERCPLHGTVLTGIGTCLLCERRDGNSLPPRSVKPKARSTKTKPGGAAGARKGSKVLWVLGLLIGAIIAVAAGFRIRLAYLDYQDQQKRMAHIVLPEPTEPAAAAIGAAPPPARTAGVAAGTQPINAGAAGGAGGNVTNNIEHDRLVAEAAKSVHIDLYGEAWCANCTKARAFLDHEGIAYSYRDTSDSGNKHAMRALNPASTIPTIEIEGQVVVGYNAQVIRQAIRSAAEARVAKRTATR